VSGVANRLGETSVIDEVVSTTGLASKLLVLRAAPFVADEEAAGL
jgi:hypothetical protein